MIKVRTLSDKEIKKYPNMKIAIEINRSTKYFTVDALLELREKIKDCIEENTIYFMEEK